MVRFSLAARKIVVFVAVMPSSDAFVPWGVPSAGKRYHQASFCTLSAKSAIPQPPDTPPPQNYFAEVTNDEANDENPEDAELVHNSNEASTTTVIYYSKEDIDEMLKFGNDLGNMAVEYVIKPIAHVQKGVPSDRIKGAALTGAILGFLAGNSVAMSSAACLSAAYLAISKGVAGDVLRTVGGIAWDVTDTAARLMSILANNEKLSLLPKGMAKKTMEAWQNAQISARNLELADAKGVDAAEQAFLDSQGDLARVLEEAEAVISEADEAITKAQALESKLEEPVDVSIPYDAAAKLAYEESDKSIPYTKFQSKFVADAVDMVRSKKTARIKAQEDSELEAQSPTDEEARIKAEEAGMKTEEEVAKLWAEEEEDDNDTMEDEDFLAALELAQEGLEGKIVGVDDIIADTTAKAEWDAAGSLARELQQDEDVNDFDEDDILLDPSAFESLDLEALGKAAREAVEMFDEMDETPKEPRMSTNQQVDNAVSESLEENSRDWSKKTVESLRAELQSRGLSTAGKKKELTSRLEEADAQWEMAEDDLEVSVEEFDESIELEVFDIEELGRQAREAVQMFQSGSGDFDEEPTEDMLAQLETELSMKGDFNEQEATTDFAEMTVAQLKEECRSRGLKVGGKKAELIERLETATD